MPRLRKQRHNSRPIMSTQPDRKFYPKIGGTLTWACEKLATGMGMDGSIIVLYRGKKELAELAMSSSPTLNLEPAVFRRLTDQIVNHNFPDVAPHPACIKFAEATGSEIVVIFLFSKDGNFQIIRSGPIDHDFIAGCALQVAASLEAMN
jgi:hypothetical protein